jgi:hypothetical protein
VCHVAGMASMPRGRLPWPPQLDLWIPVGLRFLWVCVCAPHGWNLTEIPVRCQTFTVLECTSGTQVYFRYTSVLQVHKIGLRLTPPQFHNVNPAVKHSEAKANSTLGRQHSEPAHRLSDILLVRRMDPARGP